MRNSLNSYIPEGFFLEGKQQIPPRLCRESLALVNASDHYRILACRGELFAEGALLASCCELPSSELAFLETTLCTHRAVALLGKRGPILLFGDLLTHTGLLLAVCPQLPPSSLRRALLAIGKGDVLCSSALPNEELIPHATDVESADCLRELFFYLDRMLTPREAISFWTQTRLASGISGCAVEAKSLPIASVSLSDAEQARLSAFLLSYFLRCRQQDGAVSAHVNETDLSFSYRMELLSTRSDLQDASTAHSALLALPAFRQFQVREEGDATTMELLLAKGDLSGKLLTEAHAISVLRITLRQGRGA